MNNLQFKQITHGGESFMLSNITLDSWIAGINKRYAHNKKTISSQVKNHLRLPKHLKRAEVLEILNQIKTENF